MYANLDIVKILVKAGGRDLVLSSSAGNTSLHYVCKNEVAGADVVKILVDIGDKDLLLARDGYNGTALHCVCSNKSCIKSLKVIVEAGQNDILLARNKSGATAFHVALKKGNPHGPKFLKYFVEAGGTKLLSARDTNTSQSCLDRIKILEASSTRYQSEEWKQFFAFQQEQDRDSIGVEKPNCIVTNQVQKNEKKLQAEIEDLHQDITIMQLEQDETKGEVQELTQQYGRKIEKLENEIMGENDPLKKAHTGSDCSDEDVTCM